MLKHGNTVVATITAGLLALLLMLAGCENQQNAADVGQESTAPAPLPPAGPPPAYSFKQPGKWAGKLRIETLDDKAADAMVPYARRIVMYLYLSQDKQRVDQPLMLIVEMAESDWSKSKKLPGPALGKLLGKREGYVFILCLPQVSPYPDQSEDYQAFRDLMLDEAAAVRAFSFNSGH